MQALHLNEDLELAIRIAQHLTTEHPADVSNLKSETIQERALRGIAIAREHGQTWQSSLQGFVVLMFLASPVFYRDPAVRAVFSDPSLPPDSHLDVLMSRTSVADWARIRSSFQESDWNFSQMAASA